MQDRTSRTGFQTGTPELNQAWGEDERRCVLFRLGRAGLLLLAIAVALWGYGYKISLLLPEQDPAARFPVAKALNDHRLDKTPESFRSVKQRPRIPLEITPAALIVRLHVSYPSASGEAPTFHAHPRALPFFHTALPLRSPPAIAA